MCDDLLWNSFVHPCSNVKTLCCNFLSIVSACLFSYQDSNGCHPLQDGSSNASESGPQWWGTSEPSATTSTFGGMASCHGNHQHQHPDAFATLARVQPRARQSRESRWREIQQSALVCYPQLVHCKSAKVFQQLWRGHGRRWLDCGHEEAFWM